MEIHVNKHTLANAVTVSKPRTLIENFRHALLLTK